MRPNEDLEIVTIPSKLSVEWPSDLIESDYNIKVTLVYTTNVGESILRRYELKETLDAIFGENSWKYYDNFGSSLEDVLFIKDIDNLLTNMLLSKTTIKDKFAKIEIYRPTE